MLKIRFNTTERAVRDGLVVAYRRIHPRYIEKKKFCKTKPLAITVTAMNIKHNHAKSKNSQSAPSAQKQAIPKTIAQNQI